MERLVGLELWLLNLNVLLIDCRWHRRRLHERGRLYLAFEFFLSFLKSYFFPLGGLRGLNRRLGILNCMLVHIIVRSTHRYAAHVVETR